MNVNKPEAPKGYQLIPEFKSDRMQLLLRPQTKEGVRKAAEKIGISMNELINRILEDWLEWTHWEDAT